MSVAIATFSAIIYTLAGCRAFAAARQQSIRGGEPSGAEVAIGVLWPLALLLIGMSVLFFDEETPGFQKTSKLSSDQRQTGE